MNAFINHSALFYHFYYVYYFSLVATPLVECMWGYKITVCYVSPLLPSLKESLDIIEVILERLQNFTARYKQSEPIEVNLILTKIESVKYRILFPMLPNNV